MAILEDNIRLLSKGDRVLTSDKPFYVAFGRKTAPPENVPEGRQAGSDNPVLCQLWQFRSVTIDRRHQRRSRVRFRYFAKSCRASPDWTANHCISLCLPSTTLL